MMVGLEELKEEVVSNAQKEARKLEQQAELAAKEIIRKAKEEAKEKLKIAAEEARALVESERSERIAAAHLEAKKIASEAREEAVNFALREIWKKFAKKSKEYPQILRKLIRQGVRELGGGNAVVYVRKEDRKFVQGLGVKVSKKGIECAGGGIVESLDGKVRVNKTFEVVFEEKKEELRKKIYEALFK